MKKRMPDFSWTTDPMQKLSERWKTMNEGWSADDHLRLFDFGERIRRLKEWRNSGGQMLVDVLAISDTRSALEYEAMRADEQETPANDDGSPRFRLSYNLFRLSLQLISSFERCAS